MKAAGFFRLSLFLMVIVAIPVRAGDLEDLLHRHVHDTNVVQALRQLQADRVPANQVARLLWANGHPDDALLVLDLLPQTQWAALDYYMAAFAALDTLQIEKAAAWLNAVTASHPDYYPAKMTLLRTLWSAGSLTDLRKALATMPEELVDTPLVLSMKGRLALMDQRWEDAIRSLSFALQKQPGATALFSPLATALAASGREEQAQKARQSAGTKDVIVVDPWREHLMANSTNAQQLKRFAEQIMAVGRWQQAYEMFQKATTYAEQPNSEIQHNLGVAASNLGQIEDAIAHFHAANQIKPSADSWAGLAAEQQKKSQNSAARESYQAALLLDERHLAANLNLGNLLRRSGKCGQAITYYRRVTEVYAERADGWRALAHCLQEIRDEQGMKEWVQHINAAVLQSQSILQQLYYQFNAVYASQLPLVDLQEVRQWARKQQSFDAYVTLAMVSAAHGQWHSAQQLIDELMRSASFNQSSPTTQRLLQHLHNRVENSLPPSWP